MHLCFPSSSTQALNMPPQLKSATIALSEPTSSIPTMPPSPSPVLPQRSPADLWSSPPDPATRETATASGRFGVENREIAAALRTALTRRNESPLPVPDMATAWRQVEADCSKYRFAEVWGWDEDEAVEAKGRQSAMKPGRLPRESL